MSRLNTENVTEPTAPRKRARSAPAVPTPVPKLPNGAPPGMALDAPASAPEAPLRRANKRSEQTIDNIFAATEQVILQTGTERVSILDVCTTAGISRGTFYRYFASQEELLDAFARHKRESFHNALSAALLPCIDPDERFARLLEFLDAHIATGASRRLLLVAPEFALSYFKRIFHDAVVRFQLLLEPVFDAWDARLKVKLDRELICELIVRFMLSENLAGDDTGRSTMPQRIGRMVNALRFGGMTRPRH